VRRYLKSGFNFNNLYKAHDVDDFSGCLGEINGEEMAASMSFAGEIMDVARKRELTDKIICITLLNLFCSSMQAKQVPVIQLKELLQDALISYQQIIDEAAESGDE
jgi:hypothetical protein